MGLLGDTRLSVFVQALLSFLFLFSFENLFILCFYFWNVCWNQTYLAIWSLLASHLQTPEAKESVNGEKTPSYAAAAVTDIKIHLPGRFLRINPGALCICSLSWAGGEEGCVVVFGWSSLVTNDVINSVLTWLPVLAQTPTNFMWDGRIFHFFLCCVMFL